MCRTQFQKGFRILNIPETRIDFANFKQNEADKSMNGSVSGLSGTTPWRPWFFSKSGYHEMNIIVHFLGHKCREWPEES
jgi:hypothetical protein